MNRTKVKGVWLNRVVYNDGESEELWVNEISKYVNGVDNHDDDLMMVLIVNLVVMMTIRMHEQVLIRLPSQLYIHVTCCM